MLSGVGNADDLKKLGIPVVCHLSGVYDRFSITPCNVLDLKVKDVHVASAKNSLNQLCPFLG